MKKLSILLMVAFSIFLATSVSAYPLNDYILNISAAGIEEGNTGLNDVANVDEWQFVANSIIAFHDNDGSGGLSTGDTFDDFVALRVTGFSDSSTGDITPGNYGSDKLWEMTAIAEFSGIQTSPGTYALNPFAPFRFDLYVDAAADGDWDVDFDPNSGEFTYITGNSFTGADFTDLTTVSDGTRVESGNLLYGAGVNTDPTGITGTLSLVLDMVDHLHTMGVEEFFELDPDGLPFNMDLILGIVDSNNNPEPTVDHTAFETFFQKDFTNLGENYEYDFIFESRNDGSFNKEVVPEPTTMLLMGIGLLAISGISRRRKD